MEELIKLIELINQTLYLIELNYLIDIISNFKLDQKPPSPTGISKELLVLISACIGGGFAIIGQIISAYFSRSTSLQLQDAEYKKQANKAVFEKILNIYSEFEELLNMANAVKYSQANHSIKAPRIFVSHDHYLKFIDQYLIMTSHSRWLTERSFKIFDLFANTLENMISEEIIFLENEEERVIKANKHYDLYRKQLTLLSKSIDLDYTDLHNIEDRNVKIKSILEEEFKQIK